MPLLPTYDGGLRLFWKALALFGSGSFFVVGWGVLTDPLCNSVSFRGGGARTVLTTCYPDSSGDFSKLSAVTGSWLIGLAILGILFWPTIKVFFSNYQFRQKLSQVTQEHDNQQDLREGVNEAQGESSTQTYPQLSNLTKRISDNKLIAGVLVALLLFGFYKVAAPKISLLNPITCSSLKEDLAAKDVIRRQIWNSYQNEVSNLSRVEMFSSAYYLQVGNAARRALQLNLNDAEGYLLMKAKTHCVKDMSNLQERIVATNTAISYLQGIGTIDGKKFSVDNGWNVDYYRSYSDFSVYIK